MLLDDRRAYQILDIQSEEKEMRENSTHRQPKQRFRIIQNQCILLLWSRLLRRIILSTGLISFQWIAKHLFMNTYSCTCICWIGMYLLDSIIHLWMTGPWCLHYGGLDVYVWQNSELQAVRNHLVMMNQFSCRENGNQAAVCFLDSIEQSKKPFRYNQTVF